MKKIITSNIIVFLVVLAAQAQPVFVKDIVPSASNFTEAGSLLFFTSGDSLWKSDGTVSGTGVIKTGLDNPGNLFEANGLLYFLNERSGVYPYQYEWKELWRSNGTPGGTVLLKESDVENVQVLDSVGSTLYFTVHASSVGRELWKTNGTVAGTQLVKNIRPGAASGITNTFAEVIGNELFFVANDGTHGEELWKTNGTASGTVMVKDINPGAGNGVRVGYASSEVANNSLFFVGNDGMNGAALWKSNGTAAGTIMLKDVNPSSMDYFYEPVSTNVYNEYMPPSYITNVNGTIFFVPLESAESGQDYVHLWKSNGTASGTVQVKKIPLESVDGFMSLNGKLIFTGNIGISYEVWASDGTSGGTIRLKANTRGGDNYLSAFIRVGNNVVFTDNVQGYGYQLWKTDATVAGTQLIREMNSAPGDMEAVNNFLFYTEHGVETYYESGDGINDFELWQSDLTPEGTFMVKNISDRSFAFSNNLEKVGNSLFFSTDAGFNIYARPFSPELWKYTPDPFVVHELTLVNSVTDTDIRPLKENDTLYTDQQITIRAKKSGPVGSVRFFINDVLHRTENVTPYALAGDLGGDYNEWMKEEGVYRITAIPYSGSGGSGTAGKPFTKNIRVISPEDTLDAYFTLVNSDTDRDIRNLHDYDTICYSSHTNITVRANPATTVGSVVFFLNGSRFWGENVAPYALRGDTHGDYARWSASYGNYTLTANAYSGSDGRGELLESRTIHFSVVPASAGSARQSALLSEDVSMYPNPASDRLSVSLSEAGEEISEITIVSPTGDIYYQGLYSNTTAAVNLGIDLSELNMNPGLYFVKVKSTDSKERVVKLIKN